MVTSSSKSQLSNPRLRLLCLSNGHGEDVIAVRILQELLHSHPTPLNISALPLVGEGRAYKELDIPLISAVQTMPSGGFIYMDSQQLVRDLQGGLLQLTRSQIRAVRGWARSQAECGAILAVGDIVPLLFAWLSGATYAFVGTAKSEYYLRNTTGMLLQRSLLARWEGWSGSVYHPWERWLMNHPRCKAVFPRDSLTTEILQKWSVPAFDLGNPMMDQLKPVKLPQRSDAEMPEQTLRHSPPQAVTITLLPGSRPPEAYANWQQILVAVAALSETFPSSLLFLGAIAPSLNLEPLRQILLEAGFQEQEHPSPISDPNALTFSNKNAHLILSQHAYQDCLQLADIAIAMAGTATEQFVGLGKPVITFPGIGPQFTPIFAEAQSRLLGPSLILVEHPLQVAGAVQSLLGDPDRLQQIAKNGIQRMGKPGAARRIAACLSEKLIF